ncbi:4-amino-4-deoxy-L-arabinose transferase [Cohnella sp. CFH 77786]|nr:4-amino-4-deoxy-L-arabinose transferase [Cohnella sp. CFH 77786]
MSKPRSRADIPLILTMLLSVFLNGYNIWQETYANTYYTTAVASMLQSFHNFFFASLDSAGSVTVDKPPVTFWVQTVFAYLFGLHGWSVILPQALAGVGSVLLVYRLVKPSFGVAAARIGALAMAAAPVAVAVSRTNNIDSMLVSTLLLGTWFLFKGIRSNRIGPVFGAFALIGLAFNMKMMQAYMVLPAFVLFFWLSARFGWRKKAGVLAGAIAVMVVISLSWAVAVDAVPADKRPYIGSSDTNSVLELALGYNGISRLTGNRGPGGSGGMAERRDDGGRTKFGAGNEFRPLAANGAGGAGQPQAMDGTRADRTIGTGRWDRDGRSGFGGPGGSGGMYGTGTKGPLRLFQSELSGQASWLIPFAAFGAVGLLAGIRRRNLTDRHKETLFWLAWLLPGMAFFSVAGFFHSYYLIMLAPPVAALVGAGWSRLWTSYRGGEGWQSWLLPAAILATAAFQYYVIHPYDSVIGRGWSTGIAAGGGMAAALLAVWKKRGVPLRITAVAGLLVLFVGPLYWSATPIVYGQNSMLPQAGPTTSGGRGGMGMPGAESGSGPDQKTLAYLLQHNSGEEYLFATNQYTAAAPYLIDEGEKVIVMGGFQGRDPAYSTDELEALVAQGKVKYFLLSGNEGGPGGGNSKLTRWIQEHGTVVPSTEWQSANGDSGGRGGMGRFRGGNMTLYEVTLGTGGTSS